MIFETFAFFGIVVALLVLGAEAGKKPFFGIAASVMLLILSFWVLLDGLQMQQGTVMNQNQIATGSSQANITSSDENATSFKNTTISGTTANSYSDIQLIPVVGGTKEFLWLILMLSGLYGIFAYAEDIHDQVS